MTSTGLILIPLGFALLLTPWPNVLMALPTFALLHGAAVVNVGSVGLQPGYFLALLVIARTFFEITLLRQPLNRDALLRIVPLALLVIVSVLTLWIGIAFFTGEIVVVGGTDGYDIERARPYQFRRENLTQVIYIVINTMLVYAIAHQAARLSPEQLLIVIDRAVIAALILAILVCVWQLGAFYIGLYFPTDFFFSNVGYYRADSQGFFGYLRLNGPFTEPSALSYFLSGFLFYCWKRSRQQPTVLWTVLVVASIAAIFLAFSTTGYIVLAVFSAAAAVDLVASAKGRLKPLRMTLRGIATGALLLIAVLGLGLWTVRNWEGVNAILDVALFDKDETSSFEVRSGTDLMALEIVVQTIGFGIGLGSHKPNSLVLTLLSNVGLAGTALFGLFVLDLLRPRRSHSAPLTGRLHFAGTPLRFFIMALLLVHAVSNPNFNVVIFWIALGLMAGYLASSQRLAASSPLAAPAELEAPARRRRTVRVEAAGERRRIGQGSGSSSAG